MNAAVKNIIFLVLDAGIEYGGITSYCNMYYNEFGSDINFYFIYHGADYTKGQRNTIKFTENNPIIKDLFDNVLTPNATILISTRLGLFNEFFRAYPSISVRYPVIVEHHANMLDYLCESKWLREHFLPEHARMTTINAIKVFTKAEAFGVRKYYNGKILSIPNPIVNKKTQLEYNPNKIVFVARLDEAQKNLSMLTKVARRLNEKNKNLVIHIYGDGADRKIVEEIDDIAILHGRVENKDEIYKDACVVISTSNFEGMSLAMLESASYGVPIISTKNCPAISEFIEHGKNGYLFDVNQVEPFVDAINDVCIDDKLRENLSKNISLTTLNYSKEVVMDKYIEEMNGCIFDNLSLDHTKSLELALNYFAKCYSYKLSENNKIKNKQ